MSQKVILIKLNFKHESIIPSSYFSRKFPVEWSVLQTVYKALKKKRWGNTVAGNCLPISFAHHHIKTFSPVAGGCGVVKNKSAIRQQGRVDHRNV